MCSNFDKSLGDHLLNRCRWLPLVVDLFAGFIEGLANDGPCFEVKAQAREFKRFR